MPSKRVSCGCREDADELSSAMETNEIMDGSSVEDLSEGFHDPASASSSPAPESSVYARSTERTSPRDVWLGGKHLESIVALQLYSQAATEDNVAELESKLALNLQELPFSQCCAYLHKNGASHELDLNNAKDYRSALLAYIGHVAQEGSPSGEALVRAAIARYVNTSPMILDLSGNGTTISHTQTQTVPKMAATVKRESSGSPNGSALPAQRPIPRAQNGNPPPQAPRPSVQATTSVRPDQPSMSRDLLAKYTMLLQEYADHHDLVFEWAEEDIGTARKPRFRISLTIQGITTQAEGGKKKDAKHEAAFLACQELGLRL